MTRRLFYFLLSFSLVFITACGSDGADAGDGTPARNTTATSDVLFTSAGDTAISPSETTTSPRDTATASTDSVTSSADSTTLLVDTASSPDGQVELEPPDPFWAQCFQSNL